jgi:uncharacterized protein (TIGR00303 family)
MSDVEGANRVTGSDGSDFISVLNDPDGATQSRLAALFGKQGKFFLCIASTHTSDIPGISAAGSSAEARRLTPCTDAEALVAGKALTAESIPVSPVGVASPVVITRACLALLDVAVEVIDCGAFAPPAVPFRLVGTRPAACLTTGKALPIEDVIALFEAGKSVGEEAAKAYDYIVLAECVPGGTTTAMAVLSALGWNVYGMLSSSLPVASHDQRRDLVVSGLMNAALNQEALREQPLYAVAAVGDPMQAFVAGVAFSASAKIPVILGGGSQMLAVHALLKALNGTAADGTISVPRPPIVATTKWVAFDPNARTVHLSRELSAPYTAACPDFSQSRHDQLNRYEQFHVKEGAGAGAALTIAHFVGGCNQSQILTAIDHSYAELVGDCQSVVAGQS